MIYIFIGNLIANVFDNLVQSSLDNAHQSVVLNASIGVYGEFQGVVYLVRVGIRTGIFQFDLLGFLLIYLQRGDVFGDVVASSGDDDEMTEDVFEVNGYGGGLCSEVYQDAAAAFW